ncbi:MULTISPECIES: winged helix-turn-helix domain-containing protein [Streptomycetaceae]|uniref:Regulatory protein n=1 Tax=Streptantibioticus cattleyicolor (strain ATCC 35852 / DSM 46488 / JCM 4925 / NBRC 14057 / NRRL 8057) TaxID=1003195 RepID=F8JRX7_STREN|nr:MULTISPECIES: winged helix-turn-helix domain-containing protein [Streptomycetaceae]AEW92888.1 regulatory protein [Streptantibioticus cattleyicolor NRRL 8057 = DSM 46488]MYS57638.1 winged helix family transcriptional regulator [Streptomyces sp. SID5468]CCB73244.1 protein of unknown function [Streptantibioticus cattleyicolor NRRL 8057 = DSM 46488]
MPVRYPRASHTHHREEQGRCPAPAQPPAPGRTAPSATGTPVPGAGQGPVVVDTERRVAAVAGRRLTLTYLEFELLAHLVAHPRRVHSREQLMAVVWGQPPVGDTRTVDVHIARLRRKLGPAYRDAIVTVRQVGYTYDPWRRSKTG